MKIWEVRFQGIDKIWGLAKNADEAIQKAVKKREKSTGATKNDIESVVYIAEREF